MAISIRYPIVELIIALIFMTMAVEALFSKGPWWLLNFMPGSFLAMDWPRLALAYVHYMLLVCTLVCAAYIAWDGLRVPLRMYLPALIVGGLVVMYWNEVHPLASSPDGWRDRAWEGLRAAASGAALGFVLGILFDTVAGLHDAAGEPRGQIRFALAICGWMLGAKVIPLIVTAIAVIAPLWFIVSGRRWRSAVAAPMVGVTIAATALVLGGRVIMQDWPPGDLSERTQAVLAAAVALLVAALLRRLAPPPQSPPPDQTTTPLPDVMYP